LKAVHAWRAGGLLFERQVHALVTTVLLRVTGPDALDGDAQTQPPDRQFGEVEQRVRAGERHAVVGANGRRQAALEEQLLESGDGGVFAGRIQRFAKEQKTGGVIGDGERVAVVSVAELELALE